VHRGTVARRANGCVQVCVCVRVHEWKKRVTHGTYARQCMLALLPFLAPPPHSPRPPSNAIPRVRMYNGSTARESQRRAIYPLLFAFAGRQRTERTSAFVLHEDLHEGRDRKLLSIYNCHYDRVRCPSSTHDRQFAFRIRNVHCDRDQRNVCLFSQDTPPLP